MRTALSTVLALVLAPLVALAADPEVSITRMANLPSRLFYFDDTPVCHISLGSYCMKA